MSHHIPNRRMDCWTEDATERPWLFQDRYRIRRHTPDAVDPAKSCQYAAITEEQRKRIQGDTCDGCARLETSK